MIKRNIVILILMYAFISCNHPAAEKFVGSRNSDKYHYTWCKWAQKIKSTNLVEFASTTEAKEAGYKPCKVCKPPNE